MLQRISMLLFTSSAGTLMTYLLLPSGDPGADRGPSVTIPLWWLSTWLVDLPLTSQNCPVHMPMHVKMAVDPFVVLTELGT